MAPSPKQAHIDGRRPACRCGYPRGCSTRRSPHAATAAVVTGCSACAYDGGEHAVAGGQQQRYEPLLVLDLTQQLTHRDGLRVTCRGVRDPAVPQGVVERHDAARTQQPKRRLEVVAVLALRRVTEDEVVG